MRHSLIFDVDLYKPSHAKLYPPGTSSVSSYIESRGGLYEKVCFTGLQRFIKEYLVGCQVTMEDVNEARDIITAAGLPFDYDGWSYIATELKGRFPVRIRAIPEGSVVPVHIPLVTVEATDPKVPWIASWIETALLRVWYPTNVSTIAWHIMEDLKTYHGKTSCEPIESLKFKLHNFGDRGASSQESAAIAGIAHMVVFLGTDSTSGIREAKYYYNTSKAGFSIPAGEHSTITSWGRENEVKAYENMLKVYGKLGAMFACPVDSYNIFNAVDNMWGGELRQKVIDSGCLFVARPDSGNPPHMVCDILQRLDAKFGHTVNAKGYKVLNHVRVIQGDGITQKTIREILDLVVAHGYSIDNVAFGMGGALVQQHNRDTQKFAMKCSSITIDGVERDVFKDPITDPGKASKAGRLDSTTWSDDFGELVISAMRIPDGRDSYDLFGHKSAMHPVFLNGDLLVDENMTTIRSRAEAGCEYRED